MKCIASPVDVDPDRLALPSSIYICIAITVVDSGAQAVLPGGEGAEWCR